jgi:hypothetical protein
VLNMYLNVTGQAKRAACWLGARCRLPTLTGSSCLRFLARSWPVFDGLQYARPTTVDPAGVFDVVCLVLATVD